MRRTSKVILIVVRVIAGITLSACTHAAGIDDARAHFAAAAPVETRRRLDDALQAWLTTRKGLPDTPAVAGCVADQLHIQALPDDGARTLVATLYAVGPGSDPSLAGLSPIDRMRVDRATWLCGTDLPGLPS